MTKKCVVCGKLATSEIEGQPHCPFHEHRYGTKTPIIEQPKITPKERAIREKHNRCQVPNCDNKAEWKCDISGFKYCTAHKVPHGHPELKHTYSKIRRTNQ